MGQASKILVADDNELNRRLVTRILGSRGYAVIHAVNGQEAVAIARSESPILILMDLRMPVMDGMEAARLIKEDPATRSIRVVAFTAYSAKERADEMAEIGFDGFLSKPVEIDSFVETIRSLAGEPGCLP